MKYSTLLVLVALALALVACGDRTSIQPGEVGKVLGNNGLESEIKQPGVFRLNVCGTNACPKLVRLQMTKHAETLKINSLFLPKSEVDLKNVEIGIQFRVKPDEENINRVFEEVRPKSAAMAADKTEGEGSESVETQDGESKRVLVITSSMVFNTYIKRKAPDAILSELRDHTVEEILSKVPEIAEEAKKRVNVMFKDTPIEITELGFPNGIGEAPEEVLIAKRKLYAIEAEKARRIKSLEAELEIEKQRMAVQQVRAKNDKEIAQFLGISSSNYMTLKTLERFADAAEDGTPVALGAPLLPAKVSGQ